MRRVGQVVRISQGLAILRADDDTTGESADDIDHAIGTTVLDDNLEEIGRVVDVFGPVDKPYLAVTTDDDVHKPSLVSTTLYAR
ncbi:H/ACA ribonucleoprotein complex subunit GAR1 [Halostagnicola bangensis]